jgi:hypothetical protein
MRRCKRWSVFFILTAGNAYMRQQKLLHIVGALLVLAPVTPPVRAQSITAGLLEGRVTDDGGQALGDVSIQLSARDGGSGRIVITTRDGLFRFELVPPGVYAVMVERFGYRPKRVTDLAVQAGRQVMLEVKLATATPPVDSVEVVAFTANGSATRAGLSQYLHARALRSLPWERLELTELSALSSASGTAFEIEGLPSRLSAILVDGVPYTPAQHHGLDQTGQPLIGLPLSALQSAEIVSGDADAEWSGFAGGALSSYSRPGPSQFALEGYGAWSGAALRGSKFFQPSDLTGNSIWGGLTLGGPLIADTAHYFLAFEARQLESFQPSPWELDNAVGAGLLAIGRDSYGVNLEPYTRPYTARTAVLSGFGRFDWQLAPGNALSLRAGYGELAAPDAEGAVAAGTLPASTAQGRDLFVSGTLTSMFRRTWAHEIRLGVVSSTRDLEPLGTTATRWPSTSLVADGLHFGNDPHLPGRFQRTSFTTAQSLQIPMTLHRLSIGLESDLTRYEDEYSYASNGMFIFGGSPDFAAGNGLFIQTLNSGRRASFTTFRLGLFVQDTWKATPELEIVAGVRYDNQSLPADKVRLSQDWLDYTGLANDDVPSGVTTVSPRLGITWNVGRAGDWIVHASAGAFHNAFETGVMSELVTADGDLSVRRGVGNLGGWPALPGADRAPTIGGQLAILGPDFSTPRSNRASMGVSRRLGSAGTLHVSGVLRNTSSLLRRTDLNLLTSSAARDQHGRPVFGSLVQFGPLVTAIQTSRRFSDFDQVSALNADGWSRYLGVTAAFEHESSGPLSLFASYTYSRTTDNWYGARNPGTDAQLIPFPVGGPENWDEDVSDFDVPHRVAVGLEVRPAGTLLPHIAALYRYRSGYPFTPGFRDGVDVNADGSGSNDPAYVDTAVPGVAELASNWNCLLDHAGQFAARNACREPGVHALDVRVGFALSRSSGLAAEIFVDGVNLIESSVARIDRALYLIDHTRSLTENQGVFTLPLTANPHFGQPLVRFNTGRMLRIGLKVNF